MGDGKVALILDVLGLGQHTCAVSSDPHAVQVNEVEPQQQTAGEKQSLLLFSLGSDRRMAMPLSAVARLEEFSRDKVESSDQREVVQYRDQVMPLLHLEDVLGANRETSDLNVVQVVVYTQGDRSIGLVVSRIVDIVEESLEDERVSAMEHIRCLSVVHGKVAEIVDIDSVIRSYDPAMFENHQTNNAGV